MPDVMPESIDEQMRRARERLPALTPQLDPRIRAMLNEAGPSNLEATPISDEVQGVLAAAIQEMRTDPASPSGGVAPVLGGGVLAEFLKNGSAHLTSAVFAARSRIDERR